MPEMKYARGEFQARIRQVEHDVFRAEYSGEVNPENPDERELLDFHIGTNEKGVRVWVEEMAKGLGYSNAVWLDH